MAEHGKQFTLYSHQTGPNGWCVSLFVRVDVLL